MAVIGGGALALILSGHEPVGYVLIGLFLLHLAFPASAWPGWPKIGAIGLRLEKGCSVVVGHGDGGVGQDGQGGRVAGAGVEVVHVVLAVG